MPPCGDFSIGYKPWIEFFSCRKNHVLTVERPNTRMSNCFANAPLAQLVEQGTFNPKVAGSIPSRRTILNNNDLRFCRGSFLFAVHTVHIFGTNYAQSQNLSFKIAQKPTAFSGAYCSFPIIQYKRQSAHGT